VLVDGAADVVVAVAAGPGGGATVEQPPSRPRAATTASAVDRCMNDGNRRPVRPPNADAGRPRWVEGAESDRALG
jgi:hypothetical protein